jgi:hypothetical protein
METRFATGREFRLVRVSNIDRGAPITLQQGPGSPEPHSNSVELVPFDPQDPAIAGGRPRQRSDLWATGPQRIAR